MQKINIIPHMIFETSKIKNSCNLIGGEHFGQLDFPQKCNFNKIIQPIMGHHLKHKSNVAPVIMPNIPLLVQICQFPKI